MYYLNPLNILFSFMCECLDSLLILVKQLQFVLTKIK
jgi:hypothetical protein